MEKTVLFACTTLDEHSTLSRNFEYINKFIKKNYKNDVINSYFACYLPPNCKKYIIEQEYSSYLEDTLIENNYIVNKKDDKSYVYNNMIIKFIKNNNNVSFDMIIMTECDNFLLTITGKWINLNGLNEDIFDVIIKNMLILHNSLNKNGLVYNFKQNNKRSLKTFNNEKYNPTTTKRNFDYDYNIGTPLEFIIFIAFINRVRKLLFKNISRGKYIKRDINIEEYYIKCETIKEKIKKKFKKKINSKKMNSKDILEYLLCKYVKLNSNDIHNVEYYVSKWNKNISGINDISNEEIERVFNLYKDYLNK